MFLYRSRCSCGTKVRIEVGSTYLTTWKERIQKWEDLHRDHGGFFFSTDGITTKPVEVAKITTPNNLTPSDDSAIVPPSSGDTPA